MPGGNDTSAFSATQVFSKNGATDDATVYVRYRNVIITALMQGLNQTTGAKKYGPVSMSDLAAAATDGRHARWRPRSSDDPAAPGRGRAGTAASTLAARSVARGCATLIGRAAART